MKVDFFMKKYIGNIVTSKNYNVDSCFKKCLNISDIDKNLPTLIIGLQNAKNIISDFNILKKRYDNDMIWWTFSKSERRVDHDSDIIEFHSYCILNITKNIKYININYINITYTKAKEYINYINNNNKKYYFIDNNKFVFVYDTVNSNDCKQIYGFSLNTSAFFGISKAKIISLIENNPNNIKISNFYSLPNKIRGLVNDDIPSEIILSEYF
jgi:hypothetical protein